MNLIETQPLKFGTAISKKLAPAYATLLRDKLERKFDTSLVELYFGLDTLMTFQWTSGNDKLKTFFNY